MIENSGLFYLELLLIGQLLELESPKGLFSAHCCFLYNINAIVEDIHSSISLFADDTSLYIIADDPTESAITLNSDQQKIQKWASEWLVTFNPAKSEALLLSRKINKP